MNAYCISPATLRSHEQKLLHVEFHTISFKGMYQHSEHFQLCTHFYTVQFCGVNSLC